MADMKTVLVLAMSASLLAWAGCKKDKSSTTSASAEADPVLLLDEGSEPRTALRYKIAEGTTTTSNMDLAIARLATNEYAGILSVMPGLRLHIVSGPAISTERGVRFDVRITKAEAVVPKGVDPQTAEQLRESASVLDDVGGTVEMNDRGILLAAELNDKAKSADVPPRLLMAIINARSTLSRVALPAAPVGLGARWQAKKDLVLYGFKVQQVDTYTLVNRVGDEIKLNVSVTQNALPQTVDFPDAEISLTVEQMTANANGEVVLNLNALESDAGASGQSATKLTVTSPDGIEKIDVDGAIELRLTNTTAFE
jgi:hypothetical protein